MRPYLRSYLRHLHVLLLLALILSLTGSATFAVTPVRAITFYTVDTLTDELDGDCTLPDDCSLRDALDLSTTGDVINFSVTGTINLTLGELVVDHNVTIAGPGADDLTINAGDLSRILSMGAHSVGLSGLTLTGGSHGDKGGALYMAGAGLWTLDNMVITDNQAGAPDGYNFGGAIYMSGGTLTITNSEISYNTLVSGTGTTQGGALYAANGILNLTNVTFSGNHAGTGGSYGEGGAAQLANGLTANINNSTFAGNESGYSGGGFQVHSSATAINLKNTIAADNTAPQGPDCFASALSITSEDYNLIESTTDCTISGTTTHNIYGEDPLLHVLGTYGGTTGSRPLGAGSPAIDAGNDATCAGTDQRGWSRPAGAHCDIGAFEVQVLTVTKTADTADGTCDSDCSLREAIIATPPGSLVNFALGGTFPLGSPLPNIEKVISIDGTGQSVTLDGQDSNRIFVIDSNGDLTAENLTLSNGYDVGHGGAVYFIGGTGTFRNTTFRDNVAGDGATLYSAGGAIIVVAGTLNLYNTTFSNNQAVPAPGSHSSGGAVYSQGVATIVNSTFNGNSASYGGAFQNNYGSLTAFSSTFSGNTGLLEGGGIYNVGTFVLNLSNTILADSTSGYDCYVQFGGTLGTNLGNLIENNFGCAAPAVSDDPMLNTLGDYGGPTETMPLMAGSPAIDAGVNAACAGAPVNNLDQRGASRPQGGACDIGAAEFIVADTIGIHSDGWFYLRNANAPGPADSTFSYGWAGPIPLMGDWNGDGTDNVGIDSDGWFFLSNSNSSSGADYIFQYGWPGATPLVGDWDGDGIDTPGLHSGGWFFLRNSNSPGPADLVFSFGWDGPAPLVGDWDGDGVDTIGIHAGDTFFLRNANSAGPADLTFSYGWNGATPMVGDWDGDGDATIGITSGGTFYLRNSNSAGAADVTFGFGWGGATPLAGTWDQVP